MELRFKLGKFGARLWTREKARQIRGRLTSTLDKLEPGDVLVVDASGVEVFDFSFADELFGKALSTLGSEYPGRFLIIENLTDCTKENLEKALEGLNLAMIMRSAGKVALLGKAHPADEQTFAEVVAAGTASAASLGKRLNVNLTAMNERLSKLTSLSVIRREKGSSASGREQYVYRVLS